MATIAFGVPLALSLSARINDEVRTQAHAQADLIAATAADLLTPADRSSLKRLVDTASQSLGARVMIVNAQGYVLVDSAGSSEVGSNYSSRPELQSALDGTPAQLARYSHTLGEELLATAIPIVHLGATAGAVRVTQSLASVNSSVLRVELELVAIGMLVLVIGLLGGSVIARQIAGPVRRLETVAEQLSRGDLSARAVVEGSREQRSLSRSFNEMADRIGRLLSVQKEFVADASHQLRTPLTGLRLRLEGARALTREESLTSELDAALSEVDRLSGIVSELLSLSNAGERQSAPSNVNVGEVTDAAFERWEAEASDRGIELLRSTDGQPESLWIARADIDRALDALVENAIHYAPAGTSVTLVTGADRIMVEDQGPGVPEDELELIFERFRRGRVGRASSKGHGLGLPIARELMRAWGGEVVIENRPEGGARAILDLGGVDRDESGTGEDFASA